VSARVCVVLVNVGFNRHRKFFLYLYRDNSTFKVLSVLFSIFTVLLENCYIKKKKDTLR